MDSPLFVGAVLLFTEILLMGVIAFLVYLFKKTAENAQQLNDYKLHVAEKYALSEEMDKWFNKLEKKIDRLLEKP